MAALLMPRPTFLAAARTILGGVRPTGQPMTAGSPTHTALVERLARGFRVSRQAADIRIETLQLLAPKGQAALSL
jgi:hypothetical protein